MTKYHNFIGIDIGKFSFVINVYGEKVVTEFDNTNAGIRKFIVQYKGILSSSLSILETTGGYENNLLQFLSMKGYAVHRSDTRKVKNFIRSYGNAVKTDALDAKALALYGKERVDGLSLYESPPKQQKLLFQLSQRRMELKQMIVAEKNRLSGPDSNNIRNSCNTMIKAIEQEISRVTEEIQAISSQDEVISSKVKVLMTVAGIGEITALNLLILLPEIGSLSRRKIASLAGLAPRANDSGMFKGYRSVGHGRQGIKPILFLSAMAARNSKTDLKEFYDKLISRGKKKMVALTALMRKILVIANAKLKSITLN